MANRKKTRAAARITTPARSVAKSATGKLPSAPSLLASPPLRSRRLLPALPELDPFSEHPAPPAWVERDFPSYVAHEHATGPVSSVRVLHVAGHSIEITTTYSVSIDGAPAPVHMLVDTDGQVWSHVCPYRTFPNATELLRYLVEHVPEALTGIAAGGHVHAHVGGHS